MGTEFWALVLCLVIAPVWGAGVFPCDVQGWWSITESEYRGEDGKHETCNVQGKEQYWGNSTGFAIGIGCPLGDEPGLITLDLVFKRLLAHNPMNSAIQSSGCFCTYTSTTSSPTLNNLFDAARAVYSAPADFAELCTYYERSGNILTVKQDGFRLSDPTVVGLTWYPARCPNSTAWSSADVGFTRYRQVMVATNLGNRTDWSLAGPAVCLRDLPLNGTDATPLNIDSAPAASDLESRKEFQAAVFAALTMAALNVIFIVLLCVQRCRYRRQLDRLQTKVGGEVELEQVALTAVPNAPEPGAPERDERTSSVIQSSSSSNDSV